MLSSEEQDELTQIRKKAEKALLTQSQRVKELSGFDTQYLVTELGTHQIELEMQNDELRRIQLELETSLSRYKELYDFAPVGYFTFDQKGLIRDVNLTGASMIGVERGFLIGKHFNQFVDNSDQDAFYLHLKSVLNLREKETLEIKVKRPDSSLIYAQMESSRTGSDYCRSILSDITKRKLAEIAVQESTTQLHGLAAHLQSVREEERANIARELHDALGHTLTAIKIDMSLITAQLSTKSENEQQIERLNGNIDLINSSIQTVKKICTSLRPELLDHFGLEEAVKWQIDKFQAITDIHCERFLDLNGVVVEDHLATAIFRILQEALTNIMRHAEATVVEILLKKQNGGILLKVQDNGKGLEAGQSTKAGSFGLAGMQERVRSFGGELTISGSPGNGTIIAASFPHDIT